MIWLDIAAIGYAVGVIIAGLVVFVKESNRGEPKR